MKLAILTNQVPAYRIATFAALRRRVQALTIIVTEDRVAPGLEGRDIDVRVARSWRLPMARRHAGGYVERVEVHVPVGLGAELRRAAPDCVFAAELGLRTAAGVWHRAITGTPLVVHADLSEATERGRGGARMMMRRWLLGRVDGAMVNGASGRAYLRRFGLPDERIGDLPYATDVDLFGAVRPRPAPGEALRLLYVGRLVEVKGLRPWLVTLNESLQSLPDARVQLTLAGDGEERAVIEALPRSPRLELIFRGAVPYRELPALYAAADALVMPSLGDTWALVVNEAMACGLPVLGSTQTQAVVELVEDGVSGWIFDAENPTSRREATQRCLSTPRTRSQAMGQAARARALQVTPDAVADALLGACQRALARRRPATPSAG